MPIIYALAMPRFYGRKYHVSGKYDCIPMMNVVIYIWQYLCQFYFALDVIVSFFMRFVKKALIL